MVCRDIIEGEGGKISGIDIFLYPSCCDNVVEAYLNEIVSQGKIKISKSGGFTSVRIENKNTASEQALSDITYFLEELSEAIDCDDRARVGYHFIYAGKEI